MPETHLPQIDNYRLLFTDSLPMIDVRAPIEYQRGAFPKACNLPIMDNLDRHEIGIAYKQQGKKAAIDLGFKRVDPLIKKQRLDQWMEFAKRYPQGALYCFRGGLRSQIAQQWLYEAGIVYPRIAGGYKAMRNFLIEQVETNTRLPPLIILGGHTGSGKTRLLKQLNQAIDLEAIYHHRGSAFGHYLSEQPTQINIENTLAIALLKQMQQSPAYLILEDESTNIGSRRIPHALYKLMQQSPLILLETPHQKRIQIIFDEYVTQALLNYQHHYGQSKGFKQWATELTGALNKIKKRLGGYHKPIRQLMQRAITCHHEQGDTQLHYDWIDAILINYYDPMYDYQLAKKRRRILFKGDDGLVLDYLSQAGLTALLA